MKYIAQHLEVDAIRWTGENYAEILHFIIHGAPRAIASIPAGAAYAKTQGLHISTAEGTISVDKGSWLVREPNGAYCVCTDYFFKRAFMACTHSHDPLMEEHASSVAQDTTINSGALKIALNVRAGK